MPISLYKLRFRTDSPRPTHNSTSPIIAPVTIWNQPYHHDATSEFPAITVPIPKYSPVGALTYPAPSFHCIRLLPRMFYAAPTQLCSNLNASKLVPPKTREPIFGRFCVRSIRLFVTFFGVTCLSVLSPHTGPLCFQPRQKRLGNFSRTSSTPGFSSFNVCHRDHFFFPLVTSICNLSIKITLLLRKFDNILSPM